MFYMTTVLRQQRIERERREYLDGLQQQCIQLLAKARRRDNRQLVRMLELTLSVLGGVR